MDGAEIDRAASDSGATPEPSRDRAGGAAGGSGMKIAAIYSDETWNPKH